jgi:hypothetical protein
LATAPLLTVPRPDSDVHATQDLRGVSWTAVTTDLVAL